MNFIAFCCAFSNVGIAYREGGWDGWWGVMRRGGVGQSGVGWGGWTKNLGYDTLEQPLWPHNGPCHISGSQRQWEHLGSQHPIGTLHWCHYSSCDVGGSAKCLPEKQIN